jgi:hypothetical protein
VTPLEAAILGNQYRERTDHSTRNSIMAMQTPNPACYLLRALEARLHTVAWWEQRCAAYLANVTSTDVAVTASFPDRQQ